MRTVNPEEFRALESMIDACGLSNVLSAIADVCDDKADHILSNWADSVLANRWYLGARRIRRTATSAVVSHLSL